MVEIKDIKLNLLTRLKGFFLLHPVVVAVIAVVFAIMLFGGCEKAKAETIPSSARDYFDEVVQEGIASIPSSDLQSFNEYVDTCFQQQYIYCFKMSYYSTVYDIFVFTPSSVFGTYGTYGHGFSSRSMYTYSSINDFPTYTIMIQPNGIECYISSGIQYGAFSDSWNSLHWTRFNSRNTYSTVYQWGTSFSMGTTSNGNPYGYKSNSDYVAQIVYSRSIDYGYSASWQTVEKFPTYTDDSRLKFAILDDVSSGKTLMTDIRDFVDDFPIHDTSHSSVYLDPESIILGYTVDGAAKTITLNSNNSSIRSKYVFETPLSAFDFSESDDVVLITTCEFTIVGAAQGDPDLTTQTYMISCDFPIKRVADPIDKGNNQYSNDVDGDITSPEVTHSLNYLVTFREGYGLDFEEFHDITFPEYYTYADVYLYNNTAAYNYLMDNILSVNSVAYIIQNIANSEDDVITQIGLFLDDSNYGQYYDVIVFDWIQETSSSYTHTYYYFETVSGRNKATTQIVRYLQEDVNSIKVNTAAIFTAVDNFESESLQYFNAQLAVDEDLLGWLRTIDYSINGINIPEPDYSDITSRLNYIMDKLSIIANRSSEPSEDDTVSEAISYFKSHVLNGLPIQTVFDDNKLSIWMAGKVHSWLQGTDSQTTKTSLLNDSFETLTNLYDSLTNEVDFFGNMEKYLIVLRGGGIQDLDGLYFSRFFQSTFDPDTYDGGGL